MPQYIVVGRFFKSRIMKEMTIWCIVNKNEAPRSFKIVKNQLEYISNEQVEQWIRQELGCVEEWWA